MYDYRVHSRKYHVVNEDDSETDVLQYNIKAYGDDGEEILYTRVYDIVEKRGYVYEMESYYPYEVLPCEE